MKYLQYSVYRKGGAGLSNLIISVELGVVMSHLTDRVLVLDGNNPPISNVLAYDEIPSSSRPSRVTDLLDLPVSWVEAGDVDLDTTASPDLADQPLEDCVFYDPPSICTDSEDFRAFAGKRSRFLTRQKNLENSPVLRVTGGPNHSTLSFYSYFFYLDQSTKQSVHTLLRRLKPKQPYELLAKKVARDLQDFNAVHIRRGDFKKAYGVTTLEREPQDVINALDHHFDRRDRLVILTDEPQDPFFDEIVKTYRNHKFLDKFILDHFRGALLELPRHDSTAIAFLAQLVAAESQDFVGSMTSTFTSLIQRYRGNLGKREPFKFLWNEIPEVETPLARGRHPISDCVPLDRGIMVEEWHGPYSWNRFNPRLKPAWQREWPESFLGTAGQITGPPAPIGPSTSAHAATNNNGRRATGQRMPDHRACFSIAFGHQQIAIACDQPELTAKINELFKHMLSENTGHVLGQLEVTARNGRLQLIANEIWIADAPNTSLLLRQLKHEVVRQFIHARPELLWLHAGAAACGGESVIFTGPWGCGKSTVVTALNRMGWTYLTDDVAPVDIASNLVFPFPQTPQVRDALSNAPSAVDLAEMAKTTIRLGKEAIQRQPVKLSAIVLPMYQSDAVNELIEYPRARVLATILDNCASFVIHRQQAFDSACELVQSTPAYQLSFNDSEKAAELVNDMHSSPKVTSI